MVAIRFATLVSAASSAAAFSIPGFGSHGNQGFGAGGFGAGSYSGASYQASSAVAAAAPAWSQSSSHAPSQAATTAAAEPASSQSPSRASSAQSSIVGTNVPQSTYASSGAQSWNGGSDWSTAPSQASWANRMNQNWTNGKHALRQYCYKTCKTTDLVKTGKSTWGTLDQAPVAAYMNGPMPQGTPWGTRDAGNCNQLDSSQTPNTGERYTTSLLTILHHD